MEAQKDRVSLRLDGRQWEGWQEVRVTRGIERVPNDFDLLVTDRFPEAGRVVIEPGQPCEIWIGADRVITGYVDRYAAGIAPAAHKIRVSGRGRCQDLVDCHIINDGQNTQFGNAQMLALARQLAAPYGIEVATRAPDRFIAETFSVYLTETPFDVIERIARSVGYLVYEAPDGNLLLDEVGQERHATGFVQGANVEMADVTFSMDSRFSEYRVVQTAIENLYDVASRAGGADWNTQALVLDGGVPRRRRRTIVVEQMIPGRDFALERGRWEMARRYGRSQAVTLTVDSWRDGEGLLWEPNRLARVHLPALELPDRLWTIGEVTYRRGREGERADLTLMPPDAFTAQPTILLPYDWQVARALNGGGTP